MDEVVGRLDKVLRREWFTHVQTLPAHHAHMPTFQDFASWIQQKSHIARLDRGSRFDRDKYKPCSDRAHADAAPIFLTASAHQPPCPTASSMPTPPCLSQPAQTQKMQSPLPKAHKSSPGGDKEYRDATRRNKNPPDDTTLNANTPTGAYYATRSSDSSPEPNALWCAWCTENGQPHNHSTANCSMLKLNATANDQWKVINKHRVCDSCLVQGHYWKNCPNKIQKRCTECGNSHHPHLYCRPPKQPSTYPGAG